MNWELIFAFNNRCLLDVGWVSVGGGSLTVCRVSVGDLLGILVVHQGSVRGLCSLSGVSVGGLCWGLHQGAPSGVHQRSIGVPLRGSLGLVVRRFFNNLT